MVIPQRSHKHPIRNPIGITQKSCRNSQRTSLQYRNPTEIPQRSSRNPIEIVQEPQKPYRNLIGILQKFHRNPIEILPEPPQKSYRNSIIKFRQTSCRNVLETLQKSFRIPIEIILKSYRNRKENPEKSNGNCIIRNQDHELKQGF